MSEPINVMVVEDESIVSFNLQQRLSRLGYNVTAVAASGEEALRLADETHPDIVLMDIRIQGEIDGIEAATRLNASNPLPVIFLTAHSESATIERARATRPYGYLLKPFSERELHATITMAIERRKWDIELGASEARLRLALDAAAMGVWDMDIGARKINLSARSNDILGIGADGAADSDVLFECVAPADRARVREEFERCLEHLTPFHTEFRGSGDTGHWIRMQAQPRDGKQLIGVVQDISARRAAEEKLRELNENLESLVQEKTADLRRSLQEMDTFSYSVAHDLRAPLRTIIGFSEIVLSDYSAHLDDNGRRQLDRISAAGKRMALLIDGLLNLARLSRGKLNPAHVDLSALAREIADELQEGDPAREVSFSIAPDLHVVADSVLIRDVLEILFRNAWKFTAKHAVAQIALTAESLDGETVYTVSDDGSGFDMKYADHLFRPFQRLHHVSEFEGNGIGLATAQRIVERHGGRIWARGVVEQGATFYFTLTPRLN
jgi:PAS domain S-box-containing protein